MRYLYHFDYENEKDRKARLIKQKKRQKRKRLEKAAPALLKACKAWMKVESEMADKHPCPDLGLRAQYRKEAVKLTEAAIAATEKG